MKRIFSVIVALMFLYGCGKDTKPMDEATLLRKRLLECSGCEFTATVSADYGSEVYSFKMHCTSDRRGDLAFEVLEPESIAGITGSLSGDGGKLTFDDHALLFTLLADDRLSPVSAPWIMLKALRSGYLHSCVDNDAYWELHIDDSYEKDALQLIIQTDKSGNPVSAEVFFKEFRILTILVEDFKIL